MDRILDRSSFKSIGLAQEPSCAEAYKRDNDNAVVEMLDTGHFALETHADYIAQRIVDVLGDAIR
jgi:hypothetical protein